MQRELGRSILIECETKQQSTMARKRPRPKKMTLQRAMARPSCIVQRCPSTFPTTSPTNRPKVLRRCHSLCQFTTRGNSRENGCRNGCRNGCKNLCANVGRNCVETSRASPDDVCSYHVLTLYFTHQKSKETTKLRNIASKSNYLVLCLL